MVEERWEQLLKHQNLKIMRREKRQEERPRAYLYEVSQMAGCLDLTRITVIVTKT